MGSEVGCKLAELGSDGSDKHHEVQLDSRHQWCPSGMDSGDNGV